MKLFFKTRSAARTFASKTETLKVVDMAKNIESKSGRRWGVTAK